ncbi:ABC transporter substrate-binding protein [Paenarthrobacter sp. NPDC090522]|uniref:ABC transporter substrate-binding protein n=1 Tax=Paenarthrobacter sp. NPDC090522 TaxID=3364383 RepID=UPI00381E9C6C
MKKLSVLALASVVGLLGMSGCANPTDNVGAQQTGGTDILAAVQKDDAIAAMLPEDIRQKGGFTVSINADVAPVKFIDGDGKITGLNPELLRAAAKVLGTEAQFQEGTFDAMVPGLEAKRYDAIASVADFVERQTKIDFIDYLKNGTAIIASKGMKEDQLTPEQLCGLSVGYARGTSQQGNLEKYAAACEAKGASKLEVNGYQNSGAGILSVKSGAADAYWGDLPQMSYNVKTDPGLFKIVYTEQKSVLGIGINKDNPKLRDALRAALLKLVQDGTYDALLDKWGLKDFGIPDMHVNSTNTLGGK